MTQKTREIPPPNVTTEAVISFIKTQMRVTDAVLIDHFGAGGQLERGLQLKAITESLTTDGLIERDRHDEGEAVLYFWRINSRQHAA